MNERLSSKLPAADSGYSPKSSSGAILSGEAHGLVLEHTSPDLIVLPGYAALCQAVNEHQDHGHLPQAARPGATPQRPAPGVATGKAAR